MGDLVLKGATSGQITLTPTAVAGTNTLTLPAKTGNIITSADSGTVTQTMLAASVAGNGPAFAASIVSQSIATTTATKIQFNTEIFDTNNCYDPTTNYRFTPTVAGYYQVNITCTQRNSVGAGTAMYTYIYLNGAANAFIKNDAPGVNYDCNLSLAHILYLNGSTDYIEAYSKNSGGTTLVSASYFSASLIRSA